MRFLGTLALALLLLTFESVAVKYFGFAVTRIDVTVAVVAYLALRSGMSEGAFASFCVGYLLDLMSGRPTGLYTFLAVLVFLLGRVGNGLLDVRSRASFGAFAMGLDGLHTLLAMFFTWMTTREVASLGFSPGGAALQILLTGVAAYLLFPLLRRVDPGSERPEVGVLR